MGEPICRIARENGGRVPLDCLFGCAHGCKSDEPTAPPRGTPRCNRCGSTDVRWRQQTGRWVLFSNQPGVEHVCDVSGDFEVLT
jgi:hypothetical protein